MMSRLVSLGLIAALFLPASSVLRKAVHNRSRHALIRQFPGRRNWPGPVLDAEYPCPPPPGAPPLASIPASQMVCDASDDAASGEALQASPPVSSPDPDQDDDDDAMLKRRRCKPSPYATKKISPEPLRARPPARFLVRLRAYLVPERSDRPDAFVFIPHFGSGPCHSIPRPREGTIITSQTPTHL